MNRQQGLAAVEFALAGAVALLLLFAALEMGRMLYVWNSLSEATRRGARMAAVSCPNDAIIKDIALFGAAGSGVSSSPVVTGLARGNIAVEYLEPDGEGKPTQVRVSIVGYQHALLIPNFPGFPELPSTITAPSFATTLPAESLGGSSCP